MSIVAPGNMGLLKMPLSNMLHPKPAKVDSFNEPQIRPKHLLV